MPALLSRNAGHGGYLGMAYHQSATGWNGCVYFFQVKMRVRRPLHLQQHRIFYWQWRRINGTTSILGSSGDH